MLKMFYEMRNILLMVFFLIISSCSPSFLGGGKKCNFVKFEDLFASIDNLNNEVICTIGYLHDKGQPVVHDIKFPNKEYFYNEAIILDSEYEGVYRKIHHIPYGSHIKIIGRVNFNKECWNMEGGFICSPFHKPIDMEVYSVEVID